MHDSSMDGSMVSSATISTDLFESYEQDFIELALNIKENTDAIKTFSGEERRNLVRKVAKQLEMGDTCIKNMDIELRSNNISDKKRLKEMRDNVQEYKSEYNELKQEYNFVKRHLDKIDKQNLLGDDDDQDADMHGYGGNSDRNARIAMESRRLLATGSESLERSMRIVNDIENQGTDILSSLGEQRDQIRNTREKLNDVDGDLRTSRNILSRMEWREIYNKVILVVIILILIVFIIVFLYFQLR